MFGFKKKPLKLCQDCKYVGAGAYPDCMHPKAYTGGEFSYLNGTIEGGSRFSFSKMRRHSGFCGKRARYFEPKE